MDWAWALLAGAIASSVSVLELRRTTYPRTLKLILTNPDLWWYAFVHGVAGATIAFLAGIVSVKKLVTPGVPPWLQAIGIGVTLKGLLRANLFTLREEPKKALSLELVTDLFLPGMLRSILFAENDAVKKFIQPSLATNPDLAVIKDAIEKSLPPLMEKKERATFLRLLKGDVSVESALARYLRFVGEKAFRATFPG